MPLTRLTDKTVRSLKTISYREDYWDEAPKGFVVRVYRDGRKRYGVIYRTEAGRRGRYDIGDASILSLAEARSKAKDILRQVEKGADPSEQIRRWRAASTFKELGEIYLDLYCRPRLRPRTVRDVEYALKNQLLPAWAHRKVADLKRSDVITLIETIGVKRKAPIVANHIRATITGIFRFALERGIIETSPCIGLPRKFREVARSRVLSDEEIARFWKATGKEQPLIRDLFRILLLLGQRSGEIRQMRWDQIKDHWWTIPESVAKNKQEHRVPLPFQVLDILAAHRGDSELVFPSFTGEPLKWLYWANNRIREEMNRELDEKMKVSEPWRVHDLRRTCATGIEKLGYSESIISAVLNHTKIARLGVTGRYARHGFEEEKRRALQAWTDYVYRLNHAE